MIKRILFLIFVVFSFSFGQINDTMNALTTDDKQEIEKKISEIEENKGVKCFINLGKKMDDEKIIEKTVILDIIPDGKENVNVQLKFTQDIDTSSYGEKIENLLTLNQDTILKKDYKQFILSVLNLSDEIISNIEIEKEEVQKQEVKKSILENKFAPIGILILILIAIFSTLKFMKLKGIKK